VEASISALREALQAQHGGRAQLREMVPVVEKLAGRTVWRGVVHAFDPMGHPTALAAYAWSFPVGA
jgi:hypothetical protein